MERHVYGVSELNGLIKAVLDSIPQLGNVCVRGEISNYKYYPSSGHHYFSLKDNEGTIRCVMFKGQARYLRFRPENGMQVLAVGRVSVFPRDGAYQLYCDALSPEGVGDLHVAFEQLKEKLWKEGLFDERHKKPLPPYPRTIALITSGVGAAVRDMIRILGRRYPLAKVKVLPIRVQGQEAPAEIVGALRYANKYRVADLIITGRGGGSIEDLWAFNDEQVARAIFASEIPVISAVGHEPDVTIADFVADRRAATPSHAAELAAPDQMELRERLQSLSLHMTRSQDRRLEQLRRSLEALAGKRVMTDPMAPVQDKRMLLEHLRKELSHSAMNRLAGPRRRTAELAASLDALSPLKVLGRGFALVTSPDGGILRRAQDVPVGSEITARLREGALRCRVEEAIKEE
ncbi:MAG: exodeoxyribonuclease VII large subunit [Oscillospiraceae bacterium]|nr:exodeoxyribonuclease VII large subunit [Oscillospiraceae bacterium]MCI9562551.1 exodeoxyribonuclease VII large subunit [Oscillospiraceae bacterium]